MLEVNRSPVLREWKGGLRAASTGSCAVELVLLKDGCTGCLDQACMPQSIRELGEAKLQSCLSGRSRTCSGGEAGHPADLSIGPHFWLLVVGCTPSSALPSGVGSRNI